MTDFWPDPEDWVRRLAVKLVTQYYGLNAIRRVTLDPDEIDNPQVIEGDPHANAALTMFSSNIGTPSPGSYS